jgi:hypothetical protein
MNRLVIYPRDIIRITGRSESTARNEINYLKVVLEKEKHQKVTIEEYCDYFDLKLEDVQKKLSLPDFFKAS